VIHVDPSNSFTLRQQTSAIPATRWASPRPANGILTLSGNKHLPGQHDPERWAAQRQHRQPPSARARWFTSTTTRCWTTPAAGARFTLANNNITLNNNMLFAGSGMI
jgi:hypothetical protein